MRRPPVAHRYHLACGFGDRIPSCEVQMVLAAGASMNLGLLSGGPDHQKQHTIPGLCTRPMVFASTEVSLRQV